MVYVVVAAGRTTFAPFVFLMRKLLEVQKVAFCADQVSVTRSLGSTVVLLATSDNVGAVEGTGVGVGVGTGTGVGVGVGVTTVDFVK